MDKDQKEICSIRIMFPVESDDEAIAVKKKVGELLKDIPDSHIEFSIHTMALRTPIPR